VFTLNAVLAVLDSAGAGRPLMPFGWALLVLASAALLGRRRFPVTVLAVTGAAAITYYPLGFPDTAIALNLAVALYTVGRVRGPAFSSAAAAILVVLFAVTSGEAWPIAISVTPLLALPVVLGEFARGRARQAEQAEERAALAEASSVSPCPRCRRTPRAVRAHLGGRAHGPAGGRRALAAGRRAAGRLPHRAGSPHQHRPARVRDQRRGGHPAGRRPDRGHRRRRRLRTARRGQRQRPGRDGRSCRLGGRRPDRRAPARRRLPGARDPSPHPRRERTR
jgi:hypothetical protein